MARLFPARTDVGALGGRVKPGHDGFFIELEFFTTVVLSKSLRHLSLTPTGQSSTGGLTRPSRFFVESDPHFFTQRTSLGRISAQHLAGIREHKAALEIRDQHLEILGYVDLFEVRRRAVL